MVEKGRQENETYHATRGCCGEGNNFQAAGGPHHTVRVYITDACACPCFMLYALFRSCWRLARVYNGRVRLSLLYALCSIPFLLASCGTCLLRALGRVCPPSAFPAQPATAAAVALVL